jgi:hypothetical protein
MTEVHVTSRVLIGGSPTDFLRILRKVTLPTGPKIWEDYADKHGVESNSERGAGGVDKEMSDVAALGRSSLHRCRYTAVSTHYLSLTYPSTRTHQARRSISALNRTTCTSTSFLPLRLSANSTVFFQRSDSRSQEEWRFLAAFTVTCLIPGSMLNSASSLSRVRYCTTNKEPFASDTIRCTVRTVSICVPRSVQHKRAFSRASMVPLNEVILTGMAHVSMRSCLDVLVS